MPRPLVVLIRYLLIPNKHIRSPRPARALVPRPPPDAQFSLPVRNVRHISSSFDFLNSRNVTPLASLTDFSMSCRSLRKDEGEIAKYSEDRKRELSIDFIKYPKQSANHSCTLFLSRPSCLVRVTPCTSKTAEIAYQESWNPDVCPSPLCSSAPPLLCRPRALRQLSIVDL